MTLAARAEVLRLARLLDHDAGDLAYLETVDAEDLAVLREQVTDALFDGDRDALGRIAEAGKVVPVGFMATVGEKVFGPTLCARLTGLLAPDRALEVGMRMDPPFLARIAAEMDPRRAVAVITRVPDDVSVAVAAELAAAGEFVAMGRFVGHLSDAALARAADVIDDRDLLRITFVLEDKARVDRLVELMDDDRLRAVVAAAREEELTDEALDLLAHLGARQLGRLGRVVGDPAAYEPLLEAAAAHGLEAVLERARAHGVPVP